MRCDLQIMCTHVGAGSGGRSGGVVIRSPPEDLPYTVKGLKHISIAVPDLASAAEHYRCAFGAHVSAPMVCMFHNGQLVVLSLVPLREKWLMCEKWISLEGLSREALVFFRIICTDLGSNFFEQERCVMCNLNVSRAGPARRRCQSSACAAAKRGH